MSILERASMIIRSNINAALERAEDPAKIVDQLLLDCRRDLAACKSETASVMAVEKNAKRLLDECDANIARYTTAARNAVSAGQDDDARQLLSKKQALETNRVELEKNYNAAHQNSVTLRAAHDKLVADIESLESRKDVVKAKVATAKAQQAVNRATSGMKSASNISAFSRMEAKADAALDKAQAEAELNAGDVSTEDLAAKYASGTGGVGVEDELAKMKAELGKLN